jgi:hypothetical protein
VIAAARIGAKTVGYDLSGEYSRREGLALYVYTRWQNYTGSQNLILQKDGMISPCAG